MSRMLLAPAHTTTTEVRASSCKSAEMSKLVSAPRCTPPMPPVTKTSMPAIAAQIIVAATVVAPNLPLVMTAGRSRRLTFTASRPLRARRSRVVSSRPIWMWPSTTAMVAGSAPCSRTTASTARAVCRFCG